MLHLLSIEISVISLIYISVDCYCYTVHDDGKVQSTIKIFSMMFSTDQCDQCSLVTMSIIAHDDDVQSQTVNQICMEKCLQESWRWCVTMLISVIQ